MSHDTCVLFNVFDAQKEHSTLPLKQGEDMTNSEEKKL